MGIGLAAAACDQAVPNEGPVPRGEINNETLQLPPVGGVVNGVVSDVTDVAPPDCNSQGCPVTVNPCYSTYCDSASGQCMTKPNNGVTCDDGNPCTLNDVCASD